jgi:hypothetical protein
MNQMAELSVQGSPATSAASQIQRSVGLVGRVTGEPASPLVKGLLAKVSGAPLFHEVALNNGDVVFFFHVILSANTSFCVAARVDQESRQIETQAFDLQTSNRE